MLCQLLHLSNWQAKLNEKSDCNQKNKTRKRGLAFLELLNIYFILKLKHRNCQIGLEGTVSESFAKGIYLVQITIDNSITTKKLLVR